MEEKLITFAVPCYNSSDYMEKCIRSILPGGDRIEIIIIDDGSTDDTLKIAKKFEKEYSKIVRVIHQENGGHGAAVNTGLENAKGHFFKVVDSDDWVEKNAYKAVLKTLETIIDKGDDIDMLLTNFVYEKPSENHQRRMIFSALFPENEIIQWKDMKHNIKGFSILMHAIIYRTNLLREIGLKLPEHTFYVDNIYAYEPLPYVEKLFYLNVDFYRYFIGREDQSVAEKTMVKRIDQQLAVNYRMIDAFNLFEDIKEPHLRAYMLGYLEMITVVSTSIANVSKDPINYEKVKKLWNYIKQKDKKTFLHLRFGIFGGAVTIPGVLGRFIAVRCYKFTQWFMRFN